MQIIRAAQGISRQKPEGTNVTYHIFPEYEIHYNKMPAHTTQEWHHHDVIEEIIYLISGAIEFHWIEGNEHRSETLYAGDIVRVENEAHTLENNSSHQAIFLALRLVLTGNDNRAIIRNDKTVDRIEG